MKPRLLASACLLILLALSQSSFGQERNLDENIHDRAAYQLAYETGGEEADKELADGLATIYVCGHMSFFENTDQDTGLPYAQLGCVVSDRVRGRTAGHNDRVRESIVRNGLPGNSFKRCEKELFGLQDYVAARVKTESPRRLIPGGPALVSPDGSTTIRPVKSSFQKDDGSQGTTLGLVISGLKVEREPYRVHCDKAEADLIWGPDGSKFAIIHHQMGDRAYYEAIDLHRGRELRMEVDRKNPE